MKDVQTGSLLLGDGEIAPAPATFGAEGLSRRACWVMLLNVWFIYVVTCIDRLAWGNVALSVGETLHLKVAALGIFVTAFFVGYVASNVVSGALCDWIGPRRLLAYTLVPMGVCTFMFGTMDSIPFGLAMQALMGFAAGADLVAGIKIVSVWFTRLQRGTAAGLFLTGTSFAVVFTNMGVPTGVELVGWRGVYYTLGILTALCGVLAFFTLPELPAKSKAEFVSQEQPLPTAGGWDKSRQIILMALAGFGGFWGLWGFAFWSNALMVRGAHISAVHAGFIVALFGIGALFSKPLIGKASDMLGGRRRGLAIAALSSFTITLLVFGKLESEAAFRLMAPVVGFMAFSFSPMLYAIVAEKAGTIRAGAAVGVANAFWQIGSLMVPVVVGYAYQETQSFYAAFLALAAGPALAVVCLAFVREARPPAV